MADSQTAKDLSPDTWIGLSFPLGRATDGSLFSRTKTLEEQAKHNLKSLLLTNLGERPGQPEFGSRLLEVVFEFKNDGLIEEVINEAVDQWLPYITISEISTVVDSRDSHRLNVTIQFSVATNPEATKQITLDFVTEE
jgi:phage baseplate assembly protein W|tara:strand:- start:37 stop:450 length:414 start_codon:yes stop_codon:yes gene_type:complete